VRYARRRPRVTEEPGLIERFIVYREVEYEVFAEGERDLLIVDAPLVCHCEFCRKVEAAREGEDD
jgi:hypothetical protein